MKYKFEFIKDRCFRIFSKIIKEYKYYLILFTVFFVIAFATGILTARKYSNDLTADNFINQSIVEFLKKEKGVFSLFFSYYFWFLLISFFTYLFTKNILLNVLEIIFFMLLSYIIGFDLCVFIYAFGVVGIIFGIVVYGVFIVLTALTYILILSIVTKKLKQQTHTCSDIVEMRKIFWCLIILAGVMLFINCILLSILHIFVIID